MFKDDKGVPSQADRHREELKRLEEGQKRGQKKALKNYDDQAFPSLPGAPPKTQQSNKRKPIMEILEETTEESKAPAYDPFSGK